MRSAPIAGVVVALLLSLSTAIERSEIRSGTWAEADFTLLDAATRLTRDRPTPDSLVIVAIDDATLDAAPEVLERREGMARLVHAIHSAGARVLAIDLFFSAPEKLLTDPLDADLDAWVRSPEPATPEQTAALLRRIHVQTMGDDALEQALGEGRTLLAAHFGSKGSLPTDDRSLTRGTYGQVVPGAQLPPSSSRVLASLPRLNRAAERIGIVTLTDDGGSARRIPLAKRSGRRHFVPFALQAVAAYEGVDRGRLAFLGTEGTAVIGDHRVSGDHNSLWLDWHPIERFTTLSALEVLEGRTDPGQLQDKLVLLGFSNLTHDTVGTPWGPAPGVYVHATAIADVLAGHALVRAPAWADALLALSLGGLVSAVFAAPRAHTPGRLAAIALGAGIAMGLPAWLRIQHDLWIGTVGPVLTVVLAGMTAASVAWLQEGAQARALRRMFASYVSDDLVRAMVADPDLVQLRGERRELSVLFSDIRDFTSFSEQIAPLELVAFLNAYLTPMTRAVLDNRGFVDKFIGDAVMALWGAPVPDPDHAANACRAALDMYIALDNVRPIAAQYGIDLAIGVGVNTGEVAVGNMGSAERFEYTVLGDAVNLASRLEGLTKTYGVFCIIGPATARALPPEFQLRGIDRVRVKGKHEPVDLYELCGDDRITVSSYRAIEKWEEVLAAFRNGHLEHARDRLSEYLMDNPEDPVARLYDERLRRIGDIVSSDWDGVYTHTKK